MRRDDVLGNVRRRGDQVADRLSGLEANPWVREVPRARPHVGHRAGPRFCSTYDLAFWEHERYWKVPAMHPPVPLAGGRHLQVRPHRRRGRRPRRDQRLRPRRRHHGRRRGAGGRRVPDEGGGARPRRPPAGQPGRRAARPVPRAGVPAPGGRGPARLGGPAAGGPCRPAGGHHLPLPGWSASPLDLPGPLRGGHRLRAHRRRPPRPHESPIPPAAPDPPVTDRPSRRWRGTGDPTSRGLRAVGRAAAAVRAPPGPPGEAAEPRRADPGRPALPLLRPAARQAPPGRELPVRPLATPTARW